MAVSARIHGADARGDLVLGRRIKHRNKTAHHEVIQLLLGIRQTARCFQSGDDGKVIADLAVIKDLLAGLDVLLADRGAREGGQVAHAAASEHGHGLVDRG